MKAVLTTEQKEALGNMGSGYHFDTLAGNGDPTVRCSIVDKVTKRAYASATGVTEQEAFTAAFEAAKTSPKPQTTAQIVEENAALRASLAEMQVKVAAMSDTSPALTPIANPGEVIDNEADAFQDRATPKPLTFPRRGVRGTN